MKRHSILILLTALVLVLSLATSALSLTVIDNMDGIRTDTPVTLPDGTPMPDESGNPLIIPTYHSLWSNAVVDTDSPDEGSGCAAGIIQNGALTMTYRPESPASLSYERYAPNYAFSLRLFATAPTNLTAATLTVEDEQGAESTWDILPQILQSGWNTVLCPASEATQLHASPRSIGAITLSFTSLSDNQVKLDLLRVGEVKEFGVGAIEIKKDSPTLSLLEGFNGGTANKLEGDYDTTGMMEGGACLASNPGTGIGAVAVTFPSGIDLSAYKEHGYLYFWLWVDRTAAIGDAHIMLSSSKDLTAAVSGYDLSQITLTDGWNELLLPLSALVPGLENDKAPADLSSVLSFGVYSLKQEIALRVDALYVGMEEDFVGTPSIQPPSAETTTAPPETDPPVITTAPTETDPPPVTATPQTKPAPDSATQAEKESTPATETETLPAGTDGNKSKLLIVAFAMLALLGVVLIAAGLDRSNRSKKKRKKKKKKKVTGKKKKQDRVFCGDFFVGVFLEEPPAPPKNFKWPAGSTCGRGFL